MTVAPAPALLAEAARRRRAAGAGLLATDPPRGLHHPVLKATGEVIERYSSADELDGVTYVRCGDRRASRCESCCHEYKGDAWHLLSAGVAGGKGVPDTVAEHPAVFVTLTAPSFGPVHGQRRGGLCRPRRDRPVRARTAGPCGAPPATPMTTTGSGSRCARTVTTTRGTCCGSGTPPSCGAASHRLDPHPRHRWPASPASGVTSPGVVHEGGRVPGPRRDPRARRGASRRPHRPRQPPGRRPRHRRPGRRRHHRRRHGPARRPADGLEPVALRWGAQVDVRPIASGAAP